MVSRICILLAVVAVACCGADQPGVDVLKRENADLRAENARLKQQLAAKEKEEEPARAVEWRLAQAKQEIRDFNDQILELMEGTAQAEIRRDSSARQLEKLSNQLAIQASEIAVLKRDIASGKKEFEYGGKTFTLEEVKQDLEVRFARYKALETAIEAMRKESLVRNSALGARLNKIRALEARRLKARLGILNLELERLGMGARLSKEFLKSIDKIQEELDKLKRRPEVIESRSADDE